MNCAETILYGANKAYKLGLPREALKVAAGFGGGVCIEDICGALSGAVMVLGILGVEEVAHESERIKELVRELLETFRKDMGEIDCAPLKEKYRTEKLKCRVIIKKAARELDRIIAREGLG